MSHNSLLLKTRLVYLTYQCLLGCRQYGTRESKEVTIEGRVQFDLLQVFYEHFLLAHEVLSYATQYILEWLIILLKFYHHTHGYSYVSFCCLIIFDAGHAKRLQVKLLFTKFCICTLSEGAGDIFFRYSSTIFCFLFLNLFCGMSLHPTA